jgi:hypothetical protein
VSYDRICVLRGYDPNRRLSICVVRHKIRVSCKQTFRVYLHGALAKSFCPFSAWDGQQVCRPSWIWATSLCYILLNKFVALVGSGRRTCLPSRDEKGLKDWAIINESSSVRINPKFCRKALYHVVGHKNHVPCKQAFSEVAYWFKGKQFVTARRFVLWTLFDTSAIR